MFNWEQLKELARRYRRTVHMVAVLVVFVTTYLLILPALTLDKDGATKTAGVTVQPVSITTLETTLPETTETSSTEATLVETTEDVSTTEVPLEATTSTEKPQEEQPVTTGSELIVDTTIMVHQGTDYEVLANFDAAAQLPKGVELKVVELAEQDAAYQHHYEKAKEALHTSALTHARFFDISFVYQGKEVEPAAPVNMTIKNHQVLSLAEDSQLKVVHFETNDQVEVLEAKTDEENRQISEIRFDTDSFSVFGAVAADYYTVDFVYTDSDGVEQKISTLIDKVAGSTIKNLPEAPFKNGFTFSHWVNKATGQTVDANTVVNGNMVVEAVFNPITIYTIDVTYYYHNLSKNQDITIDKETVQIEPNDTPYQIIPPASTEITNEEDTHLPADAFYYPEKPILEFTAGSLEALDKADGVDDNKITQSIKYVPFNAEYDFVYLLKNLNGNGYSEIQTVHARGVLGSTVTPQTLTYNYADFEKADSVTITKASGQKINVYYTRKDFTLHYNSNGGSYIPPQVAKYKASVPLTNVTPEREGYTFAGWYAKSDLSGTRLTGNVVLDGDTTLYAKWNPKTVPYTIAYYKEVYDNATNTTKYVYDSSRNATGQVGTVVRASNAPTISPNLAYHEQDNMQNAGSSVTLAPDGSSVLNVYYKLKRYTFIFDINGPTTRNTGRIKINNRTYNLDNYAIPDVVLGQDISNLWPSSSNEIYDGVRVYNFDYWSESRAKTKRFEVTSDLLDLADNHNRIRQTAVWTLNPTPASVEYWLQSADNPNVYVKSDKYSQSFFRVGGLNAKDIFGYTYRSNYTPKGYQNSQTNRNPYTYRFYYDRDRYKIDYYNQSPQAVTKDSILFDANINNPTYNYVPERPSGVDLDYTWGGWHTDSLLTQAYSFNKMPSNNLALYAKWIAPTFKIHFDINGGTTTTPEEQTIEKYKKGTYPGDPGREHYDFLGWYTAPTGGELYDWAKPVTQDVTLYAQWKLKPLTYTVEYLEAGTNNKLASDKVITSSALALNQQITEKALGITGYRPDTTSQSIRLDFNNNVIRFYYTPKAKTVTYTPKAKTVTYTIKYVLDSNEAIEVAPTKTLTVDGSVIRAKEEAVAVDKNHMRNQPGVTAEMLAQTYYPAENTQSLVLTSNAANNLIVFSYVNYETKMITVNYLDMDKKPIAGQPPVIAYQVKPGTYVVDRKAINGYTFDSSTDSNNDRNKVVYRIADGGKLTIDLYYKKDLTISAKEKTKVYDGTALKSSGVHDLEATFQSQLQSGDSLTKIAYTGSQTNVGTSPSTPKDAVLKNAAGKDRNYYYNIIYQPANLNVTPQPVVVEIEGEKLEKVYDGEEASVGYKIKTIRDTSQLYQATDVRFNGTPADKKVTATDSGIYNLLLQNKFTNTNPNFEVTFLVSDGQLTIQKRRLTLVSGSSTKVYDGTPLTNHEMRVKTPTGVTYTGFAPGEEVGPVFTTELTDPGRTTNYFTIVPNELTNLDNYEIDFEYGQLNVTAAVNLQKTNLDWTSLAGGTFQLTKWDGANWAAIAGLGDITIHSTNGVNIPQGLVPGRYRLQETAAPDGYVVLDQFIYFAISEVENEDNSTALYLLELTDEAGTPSTPDRAKLLDGNQQYSHRIQIANEQGKALPHTGGEGRMFYILAGLSLIALAMGYRVFRSRKVRMEDDL